RDLAAAGRRVDRARAGRVDQHRDGAPGAPKDDIKPGIVATWCVPPEADADSVWRLEDVIRTDRLPYDPKYPVIGFDEACQQLFGAVRPPQRTRPGRAARVDYEYERQGVCHQLLMGEPLRGWRHVQVTERRTRRDDAACVRDLVDGSYPEAVKIRLVQDDLQTHDGARLYETSRPAEARRILDRIEFHSTPQHGSGVNRAETEISIMKSPCLGRRLEDQALIAREVAAWESQRNDRKAGIHGTFTLAAARQKPRKL